MKYLYYLTRKTNKSIIACNDVNIETFFFISEKLQVDQHECKMALHKSRKMQGPKRKRAR